MQTTATLPIIQRSEEVSTSGNYQSLYEMGLERIAQYSGAIWNNHNLSDPGVTMLQSLCYALTELSYKAQLPIADILTRSDGKINYDNRFIKPQDILPTNPVTLIDFKKCLVDEIIQIKQVYFNLNCTDKANVLVPYVELKAAYYENAAEYEQEAANNGLDFIVELVTRIGEELLSRQNIGQLFLPPVILSGNLLHLTGTIEIAPSKNVEQLIAQILFELNNYLSPSPVFQTYSELLAEGKTNDEIFDGPLLSGGFIDNSCFSTKRSIISINELTMIIGQLDGIESVTNIDLPNQQLQTDLATGDKTLAVAITDAPYFTVASFTDESIPLQIVQNGRVVAYFSESTVEYELKKLMPQPQRPTDFDEFLPRGKYRGIEDYYSIQHHFPEVYELNKKFAQENANPIRAAKNKQLKAYLALYEQILANYLAQLSHVDDLFSFDSGRNMYQLAGTTYYFQDIYNIPGIQTLLRDVKGYARLNEPRNDYEDWEAYQRDHLNPYRQELMAAIESPNINLDRKNKVLNHLLARFGAKYESNYLKLNNPNYGDDQTAEVVHISDTLKQFPLLSANRGRSYFYSESTKDDKISTFFSGLELVIDNEININSYYRGIIEAITDSLASDGTSLLALYYDNNGDRYVLFGEDNVKPHQNIREQWVEVYQNKKLLFGFNDIILLNRTFSLIQIKFLLDSYISSLELLMLQTKGFVFIDTLRLIEPFKFTLSIDLTSENETFPTLDPENNALTIGQLKDHLYLIHSDATIKLQKPLQHITEDEYCIKIGSGNTEKLIFQSLSEPVAMALYAKLTAIRSGTSKEDLQITAHNGSQEPMLVPKTIINGNVFAFFPNWIHLLQEPKYWAFLTNKLRSTCPLGTLIYLKRINVDKMQTVLKYYGQWIKNMLPPEQVHPEKIIPTYENEAAWTILKNMIDE